MTVLDRLEKELELDRVRLSKKEMQFNIAKREDEIKRIQHNISIQEKRELELIKQIEGSQNG